jgi:ABC-type tungstate transport system permease subunit
MATVISALTDTGKGTSNRYIFSPAGTSLFEQDDLINEYSTKITNNKKITIMKKANRHIKWVLLLVFSVCAMNASAQYPNSGPHIGVS